MFHKRHALGRKVTTGELFDGASERKAMAAVVATMVFFIVYGSCFLVWD
jgi:hypothetical protein